MDQQDFLERVKADPWATIAMFYAGCLTTSQKAIAFVQDELELTLEYLFVHRSKNGQRFVYELLYSGEGREGQPFLMGLIDPAQLKEPATAPTTKTFRGQGPTFRPSGAS